LGFINADGSDLRQDMLTYPGAGVPVPLFPSGVWAADSHSFLITGISGDSPSFGMDFTIWRVPVDGSAPEALGAFTRSHTGSVTFSPDGKRIAFIQITEQEPGEIDGWLITPLAAEVGPLAIPNRIEFSGFANLNWSPSGRPLPVISALPGRGTRYRYM
jgi:hypothetical protein